MMQEAIAIPRRRQLLDSRLILGAATVIIISLLLSAQLGVPLGFALALSTQVALFILLFRRPVWAMAAIIVGQLTTSTAMIPLPIGAAVSIRFLWTVLALLLLFPILKSRGGIRLGPQARRVLVPSIIYFALATLSCLLNTGLPSTVQYLRTAITGLTILFLLPAAVDNEKDIKTLTIVALITGFFSGLVAVMQHYAFIGLPVISLFPETLRPLRAAGMAEGFVHLSYQLPMILVPLFAMYFAKGVDRRARQFLIFAGIIMLLALYFTYTRSGMYALAPGLLTILVLIKTKHKKQIFLITLVLAAGFLYWVEMRGNRYTEGFSTEESAGLRLVLWEAGARIAMDNPILGIGENRFEEASHEYQSAVGPHYVEGQDISGALGVTEPHNDFIRVWASFGTPALIAYIWIFISICRNFYDSYKDASSPFVKSLALGCIAAMASYLVSAGTHNVMNSVAILWIMGGISIAITKLVSKEQRVTVKEIQ